MTIPGSAGVSSTRLGRSVFELIAQPAELLGIHQQGENGGFIGMARVDHDPLRNRDLEETESGGALDDAGDLLLGLAVRSVLDQEKPALGGLSSILRASSRSPGAERRLERRPRRRVAAAASARVERGGMARSRRRMRTNRIESDASAPARWSAPAFAPGPESAMTLSIDLCELPLGDHDRAAAGED